MSAEAKKNSIIDKLPSPSGAALRVMHMANDPNAPLDQIVLAIQADPALASKFLKLVNSAAMGVARDGKNIGSLATAIRLLGMQTTRSVALAFSLTATHRQGQCVGFDYDRFWSQSLAHAVAARHFAKLAGNRADDEAFTVGLLCQLGRLGFASVFPADYGVSSQIREMNDLLAWERERFGFDHNQLIADMMKDWGMPESHIEAVRHQDDPQCEALANSPKIGTLAVLLNVAGQISAILHAIPGEREERMRDFNFFILNKMTPHTLSATVDQISTEWVDAGKAFLIKTCPAPVPEPACVADYLI